MYRRRVPVVQIARNLLSAGTTTPTQRSSTRSRTRGHSIHHIGIPNSSVSFRILPWPSAAFRGFRIPALVSVASESHRKTRNGNSLSCLSSLLWFLIPSRQTPAAGPTPDQVTTARRGLGRGLATGRLSESDLHHAKTPGMTFQLWATPVKRSWRPLDSK